LPSRRFEGVFEFLGLKQAFPLFAAKLIDCNAECHDSHPWVYAGVLPLELSEALDNATVRDAESFFGGRFST